MRVHFTLGIIVLALIAFMAFPVMADTLDTEQGTDNAVSPEPVDNPIDITDSTETLVPVDNLPNLNDIKFNLSIYNKAFSSLCDRPEPIPQIHMYNNVYYVECADVNGFEFAFKRIDSSDIRLDNLSAIITRPMGNWDATIKSCNLNPLITADIPNNFRESEVVNYKLSIKTRDKPDELVERKFPVYFSVKPEIDYIAPGSNLLMGEIARFTVIGKNLRSIVNCKTADINIAKIDWRPHKQDTSYILITVKVSDKKSYNLKGLRIFFETHVFRDKDSSFTQEIIYSLSKDIRFRSKPLATVRIINTESKSGDKSTFLLDGKVKDITIKVENSLENNNDITIEENVRYCIETYDDEMVGTFKAQSCTGGSCRAKLQLRFPFAGQEFLKVRRIGNESEEDVCQCQITVLNPPKIQSIRILRRGYLSGDHVVYPGDLIKIEVRGTYLNTIESIKATRSAASHCIISNVNGGEPTFLTFDLSILPDIITSDPNIHLDFIYGASAIPNTGIDLTLQENRRPRELGKFVEICQNKSGSSDCNYDGEPKILMDDIGGFSIKFLRDSIDAERINGLHGPQYLTIEAKHESRDGTIIETGNINIIGVPAPNESGPSRYHDIESTPEFLEINEILTGRYARGEFDPFDKLTISIRHTPGKYHNKYQGEPLKAVFVKKRGIGLRPSIAIPPILLSGYTREKDKDDKDKKDVTVFPVNSAALINLEWYDDYGGAKPVCFSFGFFVLNPLEIKTADDADKEIEERNGISVISMVSYRFTNFKNGLSFSFGIGGGYMLNKEKWHFLIIPGLDIQI